MRRGTPTSQFNPLRAPSLPSISATSVPLKVPWRCLANKQPCPGIDQTVDGSRIPARPTGWEQGRSREIPGAPMRSCPWTRIQRRPGFRDLAGSANLPLSNGGDLSELPLMKCRVAK